LGIKGVVKNPQGNMIRNATIKVYQSINDQFQYIDHDVTSGEKFLFLELLNKSLCLDQ
jgi:hypothetical protein